MKTTVRLLCFALLILGMSMSPCAFAQGRGSYAAGITIRLDLRHRPVTPTFTWVGLIPLRFTMGISMEMESQMSSLWFLAAILELRTAR